jgi:hypothetical protein
MKTRERLMLKQANVKKMPYQTLNNKKMPTPLRILMLSNHRVSKLKAMTA